ncbi:VWA domain-containing protein [Deinococcus petrolearius]|uniref:VWA domain-containing protein n=1 Tax=Deinococcus petrolearius TaxID=1751295 RepID=A0ABW1DDF5_9DEIO
MRGPVGQQGVMVYAGIFGAVLASLRALKTSVVVDDPAVVLFRRAARRQRHAAGPALLQRIADPDPGEHTFVLISDLYAGPGSAGMIRRLDEFRETRWARVIVLLALHDDGTPGYDRDNAAKLAAHGIPVLACTPDPFPDLVATASGGAGPLAAT